MGVRFKPLIFHKRKLGYLAVKVPQCDGRPQASLSSLYGCWRRAILYASPGLSYLVWKTKGLKKLFSPFCTHLAQILGESHGSRPELLLVQAPLRGITPHPAFSSPGEPAMTFSPVLLLTFTRKNQSFFKHHWVMLILSARWLW